VSSTMTAHQYRQPVLIVAFLAAVGLSFVAGERVGIRMAPATNRVAGQACADPGEARAALPDGTPIPGQAGSSRAGAETGPDCNTDYR
jgi:hypothetical protein